jgi:hypothetical protein
MHRVTAASHHHIPVRHVDEMEGPTELGLAKLTRILEVTLQLPRNFVSLAAPG